AFRGRRPTRGHECRPLALEEPEKRFPARKDLGERPLLQGLLFLQVLDEVLAEDRRQSNLSGVQRQKHLEEFYRSLDQLRHDAETMHQDELLGLTLRES